MKTVSLHADIIKLDILKEKSFHGMITDMIDLRMCMT